MNGGDYNSPSSTTPSLAPYQGSDIETIDAMLTMAKKPGMRLLDLGCGDGRILIRAITAHAASFARGYEYASDIKSLADAHAVASLHPEQLGRCEIIQGDALAAPFETFDVVTMFLLPQGLRLLAPRIAASVESGKETRFISNGWPLPGLQARNKVVAPGGSTLYLY